ncbi:MAG: M15 family metallopeptidase [Clostridia bacterium]|nr:M15 family metallopeptidase [Clostridia bacterium]
MRQAKQIIPMLLIICLLSCALYLVSINGPLYQPDQPPVQEGPADDPTTPPEDNPPVDNPPVDNPPVDNPPIDNPPVDNPPVDNPPVDNPPVVDPPVVKPDPPVIDRDYDYSCDVSLYLPAISTVYSKKADILLVNKYRPLGEYYVPTNLVNLNKEDSLWGNSYQLDNTAALALHAMLMCMRADGITDTFVTSAYRSYDYQVMTHNHYIQKERSGISPEAYAFFGKDYITRFYTSKGITKLSLEDAQSVVLSYSAAPGKSEHQSGLCVDFMTTGMSALTNEQFEPTAAFKWLQKNACQFGFILRYPEDKVNVTGYSYESWHYRFVGKDAAIAITEQGITLEEYLAVG